MNRESVFSCFVAVAAAQVMAAAVQGGGASASNGVFVQYETKLEPPTPPLASIGGGSYTSKELIQRYISDHTARKYFGYDLKAEPLPDGRYRLSFSPLTLTSQNLERFYPNEKNWSPLPLPANPASQIVRAGETIALDLFVNPSTGQKLVDYIRVKGSSPREVVKMAGPARDFTPADAELKISEPRLSVDGKPLRGTENFRGGVSGCAVWMDVDGHGRFVFSLAPRPDLGLTRAGEIRGTTMTWHSGSSTYSMTTDEPIATGSAAYHLYVFHDPYFRPPGSDKADPGWIGLSAGPKPDAAFRRK